MSEQETAEPAGADPTRFVLPATADIRVLAEIHGRCLEALHAEGAIEIDCGATERVDAALLQCLLALDAGLRAGDRQLILVDVGDPVRRSIVGAGLDQLLDHERERVS